MPIVTLTTDFGLNDYYVAILEGALMQAASDARISSISHHIKPYDIVQGAFVLRNAYHHFPAGSIHLVSVNNFSGALRFVAFQHKGHFFVGPDNGIFSLIFDEMPGEAWLIPYDEPDVFPLKAVFAHAVGLLAAGRPLTEVGLPAGPLEQRIALQPVLSASQIRGSVIYVDHYENVVLNIRRELFDKVRNERRFALYFKRHDPITSLSRRYHDVPVGDTLCLFNSAGYLEIAINMGKASSMLGLNLDDMVQVDFF